MNYKDKKVLIVGLARSGVAAAKYLLERGANLTITDTKSEAPLKNEIKNLGTEALKHRGTIQYHLGSNSPEIFENQDLIVVSPGVPFDIEGIKRARKKRIPVVCELELGLKELAGRVIAITGTNGKSTTTALIGEMLNSAGKKAWVGGNIGLALIGDINEAARAEYVVLEVSSYQLEVTPSLKPYVAVLLNITPDHLDRYDSFSAYVAAKALIGKNQTEGDWIVYNDNDPIVSENVKKFKSKKVPMSEVMGSGSWVCSLQSDVCSLIGAHNKENISAAILTAEIAGLTTSEMKAGLKNFKGLPHRLEFVREVGGVSYYNDSKGTNVGAVVKSIESFDSPIILIAGGLDKNTGYDALKEMIIGKVRSIMAIGEAAERIKNELGSVVDVSIFASLEDAVKAASNAAHPGDVVLLSPACASFDMFRDYAHRGEVFVECVNNLEGHGS